MVVRQEIGNGSHPAGNGLHPAETVYLDPHGVALYYGDIRHEPLLTPEGETHLFQQIEMGKLAASFLNPQDQQRVFPTHLSREYADAFLAKTGYTDHAHYVTEMLERERKPKTEVVTAIAFFKNPPQPNHQALLDYIKEGKEARERMIISNLRLVFSIARKYIRFTYEGFIDRNDPVKDLIQIGNMSLIAAVGSFSWWRGNHFSSYAKPAIEKDIRTEIRKKRREITFSEDTPLLLEKVAIMEGELFQQLWRQPTREEMTRYAQQQLGLSGEIIDELVELHFSGPILSLETPIFDGEEDDELLGDTIEDESQQSSFDEASKRIDLASLRRTIGEANLSEHEKKVLILYLGFDNHGKGRTLQEVAEMLGATARNAAFLAKERALKKLKPRVQELLGDYLEE